MAFYRMRPTKVEAHELTEANSDELAKWCGGKLKITKKWGVQVYVVWSGLIEIANVGDMIVKLSDGGFSAVPKDVFDVLYYEAKR